MLAAVNVHIVGGDPWWHQVIGPVLIAATAIAAAWIAARTANHRQQEQLDHDRKLQKGQLAYDREQRNRQYGRDAIDEAVKGADEATRAMAEFSTPVRLGEEQRQINRATAAAYKGPDGPGSPRSKIVKELKDLKELSTAVHDASLELASQNLRLSIRLGAEHPVVMTHNAFRLAFRRRHNILDKVALGSITENERSKLDETDEFASSALEGFFAGCRVWLTDQEHEQPGER
jgi:hypothetical protein